MAIYNSLWPDVSRFFLIDLIDPTHLNLMENINEEGKERDGPLVFPGYSLHEISYWNYRVYNKIIVIFFITPWDSADKCLFMGKTESAYF